jgi:hypothetical protein
MNTCADESGREAQALLYYQGLATFSDTTFKSLKLPNEIIRHTMFAKLAKSLEFRDIDKLLRAPTAARLQELLQEIADIKEEKVIVNEASFELRVAAALASLGHKDDIKVQVETVKPLRIDVLLVRGDKALLIECKRVPSDKLVAEEGSSVADLSEEALLQLGTTAQSRHMPEAGKSTKDPVQYCKFTVYPDIRIIFLESQKAKIVRSNPDVEIIKIHALFIRNPTFGASCAHICDRIPCKKKGSSEAEE